MNFLEKKITKEKEKEKIFNVDHFWDDCIKEEQKQNDPLFILSPDNNHNSIYNTNRNHVKDYYKKLCHKIPNLYKEERNNIKRKKKSKKSIKRSIILYKEGLEHKKLTQSNYDENKMKKEKEELKLCTWKPTLYKPHQSRVFIINNNKNRQKKQKKINFKHKIKIKSDIYNTNNLIETNNKQECTFRPKTNTNKGSENIKHIFNRAKSMAMFTDRENFFFMMRYKKARDEHMIKRFKKLWVKDDSYRNSFLEMTSRDCQQNYKNYLNVNNNIELCDVGLKSNYNDNKYIFNVSAGNNNNSYSKKKTNQGDITQTHKTKKYYMGILKKQLSLINLEAY